MWAFDLKEKVCVTCICDPLIWLWLMVVTDVCGRQLWSIVETASSLGKLVAFFGTTPIAWVPLMAGSSVIVETSAAVIIQTRRLEMFQTKFTRRGCSSHGQDILLLNIPHHYSSNSLLDCRSLKYAQICSFWETIGSQMFLAKWGLFFNVV